MRTLASILFLGLLLSAMKQGEEAENALLTALSLDRKNFDYLWALADFYLKTGQPTKAMETAEKLIPHFPDHGLDHEIKTDIEQQIKKLPRYRQRHSII